MPLDFDSRTDFADADRGFVDTLDPLTITASDGRAVFDTAQFAFLQALQRLIALLDTPEPDFAIVTP